MLYARSAHNIVCRYLCSYHLTAGDCSYLQVSRDTLVLDSKEVPWFPRHIAQLDLIANRTLDAGETYSLVLPYYFSPPLYFRLRLCSLLPLVWSIITPLLYAHFLLSDDVLD